MKILQIGKFYPLKGGVEIMMYTLAKGLSELGIDCDALFASADGQTATIHLNDHCNIFRCHTICELRATMIAPAMIWRLRRICRRYDIIHIHHPDPMAALALYISGYKGRVVLHWHSDIIRQNHLLKFYRPLQNWLIRRADIVVGTTPVYLEQSDALSTVQKKCRCIPIGMPEGNHNSKLTAELREQYSGKHIVFSLGRMVLYKGYNYLIEAARYLPNDYVVIIGGTGHQYNYLTDYVNRLGLQDKVKFTSFIPKEELGAYFDACHVFCLPSIDKREAFAIVQVVAMIHSRPIISTNIPGSGVPWVNKNGVTGLTVPPCDSKALARAIEEVCTDKRHYQLYCKQSRQRYEALFRLEDMVAKTVALYNELL